MRHIDIISFVDFDVVLPKKARRNGEKILNLVADEIIF